ncbi:MAG: alanine dehydrogenase [Thermodesulfovibrionales bacterium]|nr:alanine dehydrogenase [Thermodesulfovibrionales bacterium]
MIIGIPREIKKEEYRVAMTPEGVSELKRNGQTILIEIGAGEGSGFSDEEYLQADADVVDRATVFNKADLIVKVKEPLPQEYDLLREGQAIFTYLHLAPNRELTELLLKKKITGLAYETLQKDGALPLLAPMSEIAGRMAPLMGAYYLQKIYHGEGVLVTGAAGVKPAKAAILGAGVVGTNAAHVCIGLGMDTVAINKGVEKLQKLDEMFMGRVKTLPLTSHNIAEEIKDADILIGAVLVPGGKTPVLITRDMLKTMKKGAVIIDVSVDQGGCVETSKPTTHDNPIYEVEGIIHYCVANMPGAYPRTSTLALTNATLPYIKLLANKGIGKALSDDEMIKTALNTYKGEITNKALAESIGMPFASKT